MATARARRRRTNAAMAARGFIQAKRPATFMERLAADIQVAQNRYAQWFREHTAELNAAGALLTIEYAARRLHVAQK